MHDFYLLWFGAHKSHLGTVFARLVTGTRLPSTFQYTQPITICIISRGRALTSMRHGCQAEKTSNPSPILNLTSHVQNASQTQHADASYTMIQ